MATTFQTTLEIKTHPGGEEVYHKQDGQRFGQAVTVKMNVTQAYALIVTFRPAMRLVKWTVRGEKMEFERVKPKKDDDDASIYETHWTSTGIEVCKRNTRTDMAIVFEFDHGISMKTNLHVKFYPSDETEHSRWGQAMHALELTCHVPDGQTFVDIKKEKVY
nr:hypothetical protein BaRGS_031802 [Batillaria attramentaria]